MAYNSALAKKVSTGDSTSVTAEELNTELTNQGATASGSNPIKVTFTDSKRQYTINNNGTITYVGVQDEENSNDWIIAWTYDGSDWSDPIHTGASLSGKIIAKIFETDNNISVWNGIEEVQVKGYYLQLTGSGEMGNVRYNINTGDEYQTWENYTEEGIFLPDRIINVSISEGITTISDFAFYQCQLSTITLPSTITTIGARAFSGSSLR